MDEVERIYKTHRLDVIERALSVIEESDDADEHAELLAELRALVDVLREEVDGD